MRVFSLSSLTQNFRVVVPLYETYITSSFATGLIAYYPLGDASSPAVDLTSNAYNSVGVGTGVTFNTASRIINSNKTSVRLNGTAAQTFIQLESAPGSRFRTNLYTLAMWFKRMDAGNTSASGTGTGGIIAEPLLMKGGAESETAGLNMNWGMGLEAMGSNFYLSADYEKKTGADDAGKPVGRNARMLDCSTLGTTASLKANTTASAADQPHNFTTGDRIRFGGTEITNIVAATWYYIVNVPSTSSFAVSATSNGAAISMGTVAAGGGAWFNHAKATTVLSSTNTDWHFAVCTWDGTNLKTYLDGVLAEHELPTMTPPENTSTQLAAIAAYVTTGATKTGAFNGFVQHVSIWSSSLSETDILNLYNNGISTANNSAATNAPSALLLTPSEDIPRTTFVVQLSDDVGVDDSSVVSSSIVLQKNGVPLVHGSDYIFSYSSALDRITLTAATGSFNTGSYTIILN